MRPRSPRWSLRGSTCPTAGPCPLRTSFARWLRRSGPRRFTRCRAMRTTRCSSRRHSAAASWNSSPPLPTSRSSSVWNSTVSPASRTWCPWAAAWPWPATAGGWWLRTCGVRGNGCSTKITWCCWATDRR